MIKSYQKWTVHQEYFKIFENTEEIVWSLTIDVSQTWSEMEAGRITPSEFLKQYISALSGKKDEIIKLKGAGIWNNLAEKMNKLNENLEQGKLENKDIHPLYDQIYDWADENDVLIKGT